MSSANDRLFELVAMKSRETIKQHTENQRALSEAQDVSKLQPIEEIPFTPEMGFDDSELFSACESLWEDFTEFQDLIGDNSLNNAKRPSDDFHLPSPKRSRNDSCVDFDTYCNYPESLQFQDEGRIPQVSGQVSPNSSSADLQSFSVPDGSVDSCESDNDLVDAVFPPIEQKSAEFYFDQIRLNCELAIQALQNGHYEKNKNIITLAHDLKNKSANEVKKAAEQAWGRDKDQEELTPNVKPAPRKQIIGSTKRVEQFRRNLRRWMIGTHIHHIGVEWMVYARMEHLQTIASFILGDSLPADPTSSTAVTESICNYMNAAYSTDFVEKELAEPEPGKRYTIGPELANLLQSKQFRRLPTLAFTMPSETDPIALQNWVSNLRSLFPSKPAPKVKAQKQISPSV